MVENEIVFLWFGIGLVTESNWITSSETFLQTFESPKSVISVEILRNLVRFSLKPYLGAGWKITKISIRNSPIGSAKKLDIVFEYVDLRFQGILKNPTHLREKSRTNLWHDSRGWIWERFRELRFRGSKFGRIGSAQKLDIVFVYVDPRFQGIFRNPTHIREKARTNLWHNPDNSSIGFEKSAFSSFSACSEVFYARWMFVGLRGTKKMFRKIGGWSAHLFGARKPLISIRIPSNARQPTKSPGPWESTQCESLGISASGSKLGESMRLGTFVSWESKFYM